MTASFTIGGISYIDYVDVSSIDVVDGLPANGDTLRFALRIPSTAFASTPSTIPEPKASQIVRLIVNGIKEFEGPIISVEEVPHQSLDTYDFVCSCSDYTRLIDKKLVQIKSIGPDLAGSIVRTILAQYASDFSASGVQDGYEISEQSFDFEIVSSVIDRIAQLTGFNWYVDFDKVVHFFYRENLPAPLPYIDLDTTTQVGDAQINEDISRVRNRIYIKDFESRSAESTRVSYVSDGATSFFKLPFEPFDEDVEVSLSAGGTGDPVSLTTREDPIMQAEGELEGSADVVYICIINSGIRFPLSSIPPSGDVIHVVYLPTQGDQVEVIEDPDSIRMMKAREGGDGVHEHIISLPDYRVRDTSPIIGLAELVLDRMAWPVVSGTFKTLVGGWRAGQSFVIASDNRALFDYKSFWKLGRRQNPTVYVQSVSKRFIPRGATTYLVENTVEFSNIAAEIAI